MEGWFRGVRPRGTGRRVAVLLVVAFAVVAIAGSAHATAPCASGCSLAWVTQPTNALVNQTITGAAFDKTGASVSVQVVDSTGQPVNINSGTVNLDKTGGFNDDKSATNCFANTSASLSHGVATFSKLKSTCSGYDYRLTPSATGFGASASRYFGIYTKLVSCGGNNCGSSGTLDDTVTASLLTSTSGGTFTVMALAGGKLGSLPSGCENFQTLGASGFRETDDGSGGTKTLDYLISMALIKAKFGKNTGQQVVPICAGGERVIGGVTQTCQQDIAAGRQGWLGETLDSNGAFAGLLRHAKCNADGLWYGILASSQDSNTPVATDEGGGVGFDQTSNPFVSKWNSCGSNGPTDPNCPGTLGQNYRDLTITVPSPWDWGGNA